MKKLIIIIPLLLIIFTTACSSGPKCSGYGDCPEYEDGYLKAD